MAVINMKELLETGVHFGHRTRKWNPKMKPYIFTERNGIHIIDLQQTLETLQKVYNLVRDDIADGGFILFVGTKRQAQETIQVEAERCGMPYVNSRWLGGTLTNWTTIRGRIDELERLEKQRDEGIFDKLTKKEVLTLTRKMDRLEERLGGIRKMRRIPSLLFVVDVRREETAIHEANLLDIPVLAMVDTNCDPDGVDYIIPANDDAIRAIKLICSKLADAVLEGKALRKDEEEELEDSSHEEEAKAAEVEMSDDELAKLQSGEYDDSKEEGQEAESENVDAGEDVAEPVPDDAADDQPATEESDED